MYVYNYIYIYPPADIIFHILRDTWDTTSAPLRSGSGQGQNAGAAEAAGLLVPDLLTTKMGVSSIPEGDLRPVGGDWNMNFTYPYIYIYSEFHHPN